MKNVAPIDSRSKLERRACFVLFRGYIDMVQNQRRMLLSAWKINCVFEIESFSEYTSQSKAVLSALLSVAESKAFFNSVDTRNG